MSIIESATVNGTFYGAVRIKTTGEVWALVVLQHRGRGEHNYSRKEMQGSMGPCEDAAPARVLNVLSALPGCDGSCARPVGDAGYVYHCGVCNEREWRERCRANIAKAAARPKIKAGDTIRLSSPVTFTDGVKRDTFKRLPGRALNFLSTDMTRVKLPWDLPTFELVA